MKVLLLGGTGAMGVPLSNILKESGDDVYITSRSSHESEDKNLHYLVGNGHNFDFLKTILKEYSFDVIVDFMSYNISEFSDKIGLLLSSSDQYVFLSSARVFAENNSSITEESDRLLDIVTDATFLESNEYAISKAKSENLLFTETARSTWRKQETLPVLQNGRTEKLLILILTRFFQSIFRPNRKPPGKKT